MTTPQKTGWPEQELMQDDHRGLFKWFASKIDARRLVRKALTLPGCCNGNCRQGRDCPRRIKGLNTYEGGMEVRGPLSFPMQPGEGMEQDEPLYSYDSVTAPIPWCIWIGASVCALLCFYILCGGADDLYLYVLREW